MRSYYEKLQTETNWFKLFIPIFITMTIALIILLPGIEYINDVLIRHKDFAGKNFGFAVCVSLIFSAVAAGIVSSVNLKKKNQEQ
ncbi:hypothetical protein [Ruminococcus albus]|uniref:Uncharacterized protein n=1 Tax=Ruminococcus albus TaxID=1264 RepID=A0A1I1EJH9_RUMAL|nr:hypothetical protein [Ruminococcus albus]SFB87211.1 hypothetical protein SAMN02910406_00714 [Ruminococcus albus]